MDGAGLVNPLTMITFTEIIDLILVACLLYAGIVWAQRTRAVFVARGILTLGVFYLLARYFDLQMTAWIFQGFFAVFLIMIVVIFQEELRQIFERIAVWSLTGNSVSRLRTPTVDILVGTATDLAKNRIGALIVLRGKNPLERHISGGIPLDGAISEPVLRSIFDVHSPGHDGAVVVENDRISRFAAHLPLSKDTQQLAHFGTRHSAALGIAELTDAFCLVVSEERGTVSVARDGKLITMSNPQELGAALHRFLEEKFPAPTRKVIPLGMLRRNWIAKAVSLVLAICFWYLFIPGSKIVEATYKIPVMTVNLSPDLTLESIQPKEIEATFVGPQRAFYLFDSRKLRVNLDVSLAEMGRRTFNVSEQEVRFPKELTLREINPAAVRISVRKARVPQPENSG
jgi:uncharacterized protein (TIGR00159 family)